MGEGLDHPEHTYFLITKIQLEYVYCLGPEIDEKTMEWAFKLMETNMKALYESCYQVCHFIIVSAILLILLK